MNIVKKTISYLITNLSFAMYKFYLKKRFNYSYITLLSLGSYIKISHDANYVKIGNKLVVENGTIINVLKDSFFTIGDNCYINRNCIITIMKSLTIGDNVIMGPNVLIYDHDHCFDKKNGVYPDSFTTSDICIGSNVWIGANSIILKGSKIEDNCIIAAGSIVKGCIKRNTVFIQKRSSL